MKCKDSSSTPNAAKQSGLFPPERQMIKMTKNDTINLTLDPDNLPPLTAKQHAMLDILEKLPDDQIDCSDIPEHDFTHAVSKKTRKHAALARNP